MPTGVVTLGTSRPGWEVSSDRDHSSTQVPDGLPQQTGGDHRSASSQGLVAGKERMPQSERAIEASHGRSGRRKSVWRTSERRWAAERRPSVRVPPCGCSSQGSGGDFCARRTGQDSPLGRPFDGLPPVADADRVVELPQYPRHGTS